MTTPIGTPLVLDATGKEVVELPRGVLHAKIRCRKEGIPRLYLKFKDRFESWYLSAVGNDKMKPAIKVESNIRVEIPQPQVPWRPSA